MLTMRKFFRLTMRFCFLGFLLSFILAQSGFSAEPPKEFNAQIMGIGPKTVVIMPSEPLQLGDELQVVRAQEVMAVIKVVKKTKDNMFLADVINLFGEIDFDDKLVRFKTETLKEEIKKPVETTAQPTVETTKEIPPTVEEKKEASVTPQEETKPSETEKAPEKSNVSSVKPEEVPKETPSPSDAITPEETKPEEEKTVATLPETPPSEPSEEAAPKPQALGVSFGYSLFVPKSFKVSNNGFRGEARVKMPKIKNLYGSLSYAQHRWTDKTTELKLNVFSVNLAYSLKSFLPQALPFINDVQLMAGYSNLSSRLTQDATTLTKSASGFNTGIALRLLKFLNIDYRFHSFTLDFPNGKIKNGEQITFSFSYAF